MPGPVAEKVLPSAHSASIGEVDSDAKQYSQRLRSATPIFSILQKA
jgi:hypothetical protein